MARCSDRDYYKSSINKGATENAKQGATENIGNVLALVLLSYTESGQALFRRNGLGGGHVHWSMVYPIVLFLTSLGWMHSDIPKEEIDPSRTFLGKIMQDIKIFFNRTEGQGWDIPKLHAYLQMPDYIRWFGNGINFYGGFGERGHITYVKDNAQQTQRQSSTFLEQIGRRCEESMGIGCVQDNLIQQFPDQIEEMSSTSSLNKRKRELEECMYGHDTHTFCVRTKFVNKHYGEYKLSINITRSRNADEDLPNDESNCWFERSIVH